MVKEDYSKLSMESIESKLKEAHFELLKLNTQKSSGTGLKNSDQIKKFRKTIARLLTAKNKRK